MNIIYKVETSKSFKDAINILKTNLKKIDFGVLWEMNFKDKLNEKGLEFDNNFQVLEVCNPKTAKTILDKNIEIGFFLPCKMVVYENNNSVYIGMLAPTALIEMVGGDDLSSIAMEVETQLKAAIEDSK